MLFVAASTVTGLVRKHDSFAMWQARAAWWPKRASWITGCLVRTALKNCER
jgi:hypothetical protein